MLSHRQDPQAQKYIKPNWMHLQQQRQFEIEKKTENKNKKRIKMMKKSKVEMNNDEFRSQ